MMAPFTMDELEDLNIYETVTSDQGIVSLRPLIKHDLHLNDVFRMAYAVLWRETLNLKIKTESKLINERFVDYSFNLPANFAEVLGEKIQLLNIPV